MFIWITDLWAKDSEWGREQETFYGPCFFLDFFSKKKNFFSALFHDFLLVFHSWDHKDWDRERGRERDFDGKTSFACLIIRIPRSFEQNITNFCVCPIFVVVVFVFVCVATTCTLWQHFISAFVSNCFFSVSISIHSILYDHFHDGTEIAKQFMVVDGFVF